MELIQETDIGCPYCGETITIIVESSQDEQQYFEDCQVCCKPMAICVQVSLDGQTAIEVKTEDDA